MGQKCLCKKETKWNIHSYIECLVPHSAIYQFLRTLSVCLQEQIDNKLILQYLIVLLTIY